MALRSDPLSAANIFASAVVTVTSTAAIVGGNYSQGSILRNNGSVTIYLGGSNVTTANGFPLPAGATISDERFQGLGKLYAVVASTSGELRVLGLS